MQAECQLIIFIEYYRVFKWLESENYILKSPMRRIHKIKTVKVVKETYSSETMQIIMKVLEILQLLTYLHLLECV